MSKLRFTFEIPDGAHLAHILAAIQRGKGEIIAIGTVDAEGTPESMAAAAGAKANVPQGRRVQAVIDALSAEPMRMVDLSRKFGISAQGIWPIVKRLEKEGRLRQSDDKLWHAASSAPAAPTKKATGEARTASGLTQMILHVLADGKPHPTSEITESLRASGIANPNPSGTLMRLETQRQVRVVSRNPYVWQLASAAQQRRASTQKAKKPNYKSAPASEKVGQTAVLAILKQHGPMTVGEIRPLYVAAGRSPSGLGSTLYALSQSGEVQNIDHKWQIAKKGMNGATQAAHAHKEPGSATKVVLDFLAAASEPQTAQQIADAYEKAGMSRKAIHMQLKSLAQKNLIVREGDLYKVAAQ